MNDCPAFFFRISSGIYLETNSPTVSLEIPPEIHLKISLGITSDSPSLISTGISLALELFCNLFMDFQMFYLYEIHSENMFWLSWGNFLQKFYHFPLEFPWHILDCFIKEPSQTTFTIYGESFQEFFNEILK